jgi:ribosomal protein S18 acetylase RimI-like enzyme
MGTGHYGLYIKEDYRGQGVGQMLMKAAIELVQKNKDIIKVQLGVNAEQKSAHQLYEKYGFEVVGRFKKDLQVNGKFYDELILEKYL